MKIDVYFPRDPSQKIRLVAPDKTEGAMPDAVRAFNEVRSVLGISGVESEADEPEQHTHGPKTVQVQHVNTEHA